MNTGQITIEIEKFIRRNIDSVEKLEILLTLYTHRDRTWTSEDLADILYIQPDSAERRLKSLERKGLVAESDGEFRYISNSPSLGRVIEGVADAYRVRRARLTALIFGEYVSPANRSEG